MGHLDVFYNLTNACNKIDYYSVNWLTKRSTTISSESPNLMLHISHVHNQSFQGHSFNSVTHRYSTIKYVTRDLVMRYWVIGRFTIKGRENWLVLATGLLEKLMVQTKRRARVALHANLVVVYLQHCLLSDWRGIILWVWLRYQSNKTTIE